jgi:hypothetical protein
MADRRLYQGGRIVLTIQPPAFGSARFSCRSVNVGAGNGEFVQIPGTVR